VCLSLLAHGAAAVTAGTIVKLRGPDTFAPAAPRVATPVSLTELELVPAPVPPVEPAEDGGTAVEPEIPRPATPVRRRLAVSTRARAHASGPSTVAVGAAIEPASPVATPDMPVNDEAPRARFALTVGTIGNVAVTSAPSASRPSPGAPARGEAGGPMGGDGVLPEREVSVRARLVSSGPLVYPTAARRAEVEADLALEIVVDVDGRVMAARVLQPAGYGLDEEAVRAVRAYRFSPARRDGRPVRVRMPWTVQFRLR